MPDPKLKAEALNNHEFFVVQLLAVTYLQDYLSDAGYSLSDQHIL